MRILTLLLLALSFASANAEVRTSLLEKPSPDSIYIFYLHGRIIEDAGPRPIDSRFGVYDYPSVLEALSSRGAMVISSQRETGTDPSRYAGVVVSQVERLIEAGVPQKNIAIVGFSKGGIIARHVSSFLRRPQVKFVLLAACFKSYKADQLRLTGRILSVREASDTLADASCSTAPNIEERPTSFKEIEISTGRSHGAFYLPLKEWTTPVLNWIYSSG